MKRLRDVVRFTIWRERVSPDCDAWCCYGEVVRSGRVYAGGTMLLTDRGAHRWFGSYREDIVLKFVEDAKSGRMGAADAASWHGIPFAGFVRDLRR